MRFTHVLLCSACVSLVACSPGSKLTPSKAFDLSDKHLQQSGSSSTPSGTIPQTSKKSVVLPPPKPAAKIETYSVVVTNLPVREILFALARDAKINIDIHPGIEGNVTVNAIDQTLPQILSRIAKQIDMRYEFDNGNLIVMPDSPYLKTYKIDYVNMSRDSDGGISNATLVGGAATGGAAGGAAGAGGNNSQLSIKNSSKNHFWESLETNIKDLLRETDRDVVIYGRNCGSVQNSAQANELEASASGTGIAGVTKGSLIAGTSASGEGNQKTTGKTASGQQSEQRGDCKDFATDFKATVISNRESGVLTVRATSKQHEKVQDFITQIMRNARRQVLIEATIAEVRLTSNYQQGIDWSRLRLGTKGFALTQQGTGSLTAANTGKMFLLNYSNPTSNMGNINANVSLLESFGEVKVLSSPKISVMNNQTAMLRVVDNLVYFTIKADTTSNQTTSTTTYTTSAVTVPTGFTMSVTPQINDSDTVLLNLRPSITRLLGYVNDPNPALANPCGVGVANCATPAIVSQIPQLQTREMESVLKIENNQIAILGGLMQDEVSNKADGVPLLSDIPYLGNLFKYRNNSKAKTELVIFLRPVVIKDASLNGDFSEFRNNLPDENFLQSEHDKVKSSGNEKAKQ